MKSLLVILMIIFTSEVFAGMNVRVICGSGLSSNQADALQKANDALNKKLDIGVTNVSSVSDPKITDDHEKSSSVSICVTVVAEKFSDLVL